MLTNGTVLLESDAPKSTFPHIAVVIPMYQAEETIAQVVAGIPKWVKTIVVVDDCCKDASSAVVRSLADPRLHLLRHEENQGVGAATLTGYEHACSLGAEILVKMDADGQMNPDSLLSLVAPVVCGEADYAKGNRFLHTRELAEMPPVRKLGNFGLSFLTKAASGYWNIFDPTNGFTALASSVFELLRKQAIASRFFFESSMLIELGAVRAVVRDVYLPARYGSEGSHLSPLSSLTKFPGRLLIAFLRRFWRQYFLRDFGVCSLFLLAGTLLILFGGIFGGYHWWLSAATGITASTGTVMLAVLPIILGTQLILQTIVLDVGNVPKVSLQLAHRQLRSLAQAASERKRLALRNR